MMDTHFSKTLETNSPSPDSSIPQQSLDDESSPIFHPPPPLQTLDGLLPSPMDTHLSETSEIKSPSPMDTHFLEIVETKCSSPDSAIPKQSLDGSSPIRHHLPPPMVQTLDASSPVRSPPLVQILDGSSPVRSLPPPPVQTLDESSPSLNVEPLTRSSSEFSDFDSLGYLRTGLSPTRVGPSLPTYSLIGDDDDGPSYSLLDDDDDPLEEEEDDDPSPLPLVMYTHDLSNYSHSGRPWRWSSRVSESNPLFSPCVVTEVEPSMVIAGLSNLGNTCFLNAVLQCFTHTVPLVQGLRSLDHAAPFDCRNEEFCVLCALREHIELSLASSGGVVSPWKFVNNLSYISADFRRYCQEDAHEFLQRLLERLGDSCPDRKTGVNSILSQDDNLVNRIFGGRLISKLRCCNCGHCSDTCESLIDLSLEIDDADNLVSALQSFTKVEKMEDPENKFTCENCKKQVAGEKQLMLDSAPSVAAFHLKRFKNDGVVVEKIDKFVEYPLQLDLKPFTSCIQADDVELKYELYAVVVHAGLSSTSGHYFCFVRSSPDTWHKLDDSKVFMVKEDRVLLQDAYILFYARQGTPWFSSLMEANKACLGQNMFNTSPKSVLENVDNASSTYPITENIYSCKVHEIRDAMEGMSTEFCSGSKPRADPVNEDKVEMNVDMVEVNEARNNACTIYAKTPLGVSESCDETSSKFEKSCNETPFRERSTNAKILPQTPPRSPSPDIYFKESPEVVFQIPRDHLTAKKSSCKKTLNKALEDSKKNEAMRYLKKSMPMARSLKFMAAIRGSPDKKSKRRKSLSPYTKDSPNAHRKHSPRNDIRPVAAAISH